jgi:hypothetical protein
VLGRATGAGTVGDLVRDVYPGEDFGGTPYERLREAGDGGHDFDELKAKADATTSNV